jgi:hypothetical protein
MLLTGIRTCYGRFKVCLVVNEAKHFHCDHTPDVFKCLLVHTHGYDVHTEYNNSAERLRVSK